MNLLHRLRNQKRIDVFGAVKDVMGVKSDAVGSLVSITRVLFVCTVARKPIVLF